MIDKNNPLPLYYQLQNLMLDKIKDGTYPVNKALPAEFDLVSAYGVSRTTVRQAIENLVRDGYLEKRRGVGTFVVNKQDRGFWNLQELKSFGEEFAEKGYAVKTAILSFESVESDNILKNIFGLTVDKCYCIERLRYLDKKPAVYVRTYVPQNIAPNLMKYDFSKDSLFDVLSRDYNISIDYAVKEFKAVQASDLDAKLLKIKQGIPIQVVKTTTYTKQDIPIEYSISHDRGDIGRYKIKIKYRSK